MHARKHTHACMKMQHTAHTRTAEVGCQYYAIDASAMKNTFITSFVAMESPTNGLLNS